MKVKTPPMSKSALAVAREALVAGEEALPTYASRFSRKRFTLPQLFAVLALRRFLREGYRGVCVRLGEWRELREALGLTDVPHYSTLCLAEKKLLQKGLLPTSWTPSSPVPGSSV